jgi:hypothetical protein
VIAIKQPSRKKGIAGVGRGGAGKGK